MSRGRKSAASRAVAAVPVQRKPASPPAGLPEPSAALWRAIVGDLPADHFSAADLPLLEAYTRCLANVAECDELLATDGLIVEGKRHPAVGVRDAELKSARALAAKLRLCLSSRVRADSGKLRRPGSAGKPWEGSNG